MKNIIDLFPNRQEVCLLVKNAFESTFCNQIIEEHKTKFKAAKTHYPTSYRNNERQIKDSQALAKQLFYKIKKYIPSQIETEGVGKDEKGVWNLLKLNSRLRICRYLSNQYFNKHLDGIHYESEAIQSKLTFMIYLNGSEEFEGGKTLFFNSKEDDTVIQEYQPQQGDLIIFDHNLWHSGDLVMNGEKYILRSDILYLKKDLLENNNSPFSEGHLGYIWTICKFRNYLLTAGRDKKIKVWDSQGKKITELLGHKNSIPSIVTLNNNTFVSASRDQMVNIWQYNNGTFSLAHSIHAHSATVLNLCKIDDHTFASSGADGNIHFINSQGESIHKIQAHQEWVWGLALFNQKTLVSIGENGLLQLWNLHNYKLIVEWQGDIPINSLCIASENKHIHIGRLDGSILTFEYQSTSKSLVQVHQSQAHRGIIRCLKSDENILYSGAEDNTVIAWNTDTWKKTWSFEHNNFVQDILIEKDSIISVSYDGQILRHKK